MKKKNVQSSPYGLWKAAKEILKEKREIQKNRKLFDKFKLAYAVAKMDIDKTPK